MQRFENLKRLDKRTRNMLRSVLSDDGDRTITRLTAIRSSLGKAQIEAFDSVLNSPSITKASKRSHSFPTRPPFEDRLQRREGKDIHSVLEDLERLIKVNFIKLEGVAVSLRRIDDLYSKGEISDCIKNVVRAIDEYGWSHALLRRIVLIRENLGDSVNEDIEALIYHAGSKSTVVASLIHTYARDQSILMIKRSILNLPDRGILNLYTRTLARLAVQPFASTPSDLASMVEEAARCSLIDAVIVAKFNRDLFVNVAYHNFSRIAENLGNDEVAEHLIGAYDLTDSNGEYSFYKQSSVWLEYECVRRYRMLIDNYYDASREDLIKPIPAHEAAIRDWVGEISLSRLVSANQFTNHEVGSLAKLEISGTVTRSALFNYWLSETEGQIGFEKDDLFELMGKTRELARTVPINAARTAAKLAKDESVKLIMFLLLAKRSKNELDSFLLRKLLESVSEKYYDNSLVSLVAAYEDSHPYVSEYIYEIATEDFLAKLTRIAPHLADIPEIRASLHEWMARFSGDDHFLQRARTVRIDHQINRVRNEIDDHRIYVDPSRFSSWIEDEMMIDLNSALTATGSEKKGISVTCDETVINLAMMQSYNAFCANPVFGIASYVGRRIRHGTFHGHLYSSVVNGLEKNPKFEKLFANQHFIAKWIVWKEIYNRSIEDIIAERLHVHSRAKPLGLLTPEAYGPGKQDVLSAAVKNISSTFAETGSTADISQVVIDYCWRLAEIDLASVTRYLKAQQAPLKNLGFLDEEVLPVAASVEPRLADTFRRELELSIDRKLVTMYGWFKRPSIVAPTASVSLLFAATVAEIRDTIPDFDPQDADSSEVDIELIGGFYHLIYDSLAIVVGNAASYADRSKPVSRKFSIVPGKVKRLVIEISSYIKPGENPYSVSAKIENRRRACYQDANMYDKHSGISKLRLLENSRSDFKLEEYAVVGQEVRARMSYVLDH